MRHLLGMLDVSCLFMCARKAFKEGYLQIDFFFFFNILDREVDCMAIFKCLSV